MAMTAMIMADVRLRAFVRGMELKVPCTQSIKALNHAPASFFDALDMPVAVKQKLHNCRHINFASWNGALLYIHACPSICASDERHVYFFYFGPHSSNLLREIDGNEAILAHLQRAISTHRKTKPAPAKAKAKKK
jgi:hypothetical protein